MMAYTYTHTRLLVTDMAACARFYRDVMGFKVTTGGENDVYTEFDTGAHTLSLYGRQMMADVIGAGNLPASAAVQDNHLLWFKVENVDAAVAELQAKGIQFIVPPTDRPLWGLRTAHFRDPSGNLIEIAHDIPMAE